jgi:peptidyl-prolyl cis-trans isomerase C
MSNKITALLAVPLIILAWFAGTRSGHGGSGSDELLPVPTRPGTPVATFDGASISAEEIKAQIEEQAPFVRSRYSTKEGKKEYLDNMVRFEILAREAQKKGYQKNPEVIRQNKRNMVALFVQKEFEEPQQKQAIPDDELKAYYEAHIADYVRPERLRVADVFFEAPAADAAKRKAKKDAAEGALKALLGKDAKDYGAFAQLAHASSDDATSKPMGGDLQFLSKDDLAKRLGSEVAEAASGMKTVGQVLDKIVETPQGFHLIKLLGRENPLDLKLEGVKDSIKSRLIYERRSDAYKKFIEAINQQAGLKIDEAALESVKIEAPAGGPQGMPAMPRPGMPIAPPMRNPPGSPPAPAPTPAPAPAPAPAPSPGK